MPLQSILRVAVPATLGLYVLPVLLMVFEGTRLWIADTNHGMPQGGAISSLFVVIISQASGPLTVLKKALAVFGSAALIATLRTGRDPVRDLLVWGTIGIGLLASLVLWPILSVPDVYREVWQHAALPTVKNSEAFETLRDNFFSEEITTLASFAVVFGGIKLNGEGART